MRQIAFLPFIFALIGCATPARERNVASVESTFRLGVVDPLKSRLQIFPDSTGEDLSYHLYVELYDTQGLSVDTDPSDLSLKNARGKRVPFIFERQSYGKYYLTVRFSFDSLYSPLEFSVQDKVLQSNLILDFNKPSRNQSRIFLVEKSPHEMKLILKLNTHEGLPLALEEIPEIRFEGEGYIDEIRRVKEGVWTFTVIYQPDNQIMYFSVRARGVYLSNLFRYQHVESWKD